MLIYKYVTNYYVNTIIVSINYRLAEWMVLLLICDAEVSFESGMSFVKQLWLDVCVF